MSRLSAFNCFLGSLIALLAWGDGATAQPPAGYELVWADEFDSDGAPNSSNWGFEEGLVRNEELQWYQPQNAHCEDGLLVIEGRREQVANPRYDPGNRHWSRQRQFAQFTSASLKTQGRHDWCYGVFEIRARIDARPGLWPAIWTLGSEGWWPRCGEVDIMEYYDESLLANACWAARGRRGQIWDDSKLRMESLGNDWGKDFHVWRMWWEPTEIRLTVDDRLLNTIDLARVDNDTGPNRNPFRKPHYMILNLAIGGTRGGNPGATEFPARFEVDYVRVYQRPAEVGEGTENSGR